MEQLGVPRFGQARFGHCVPTCLKMVLEYVRLRNGPDVPCLSISRIAKVIGTDVEGTPPGQIERVNDILQKARPSVEFRTVYMGRFPDIQKELLERRSPVIVLINIANQPDTVQHAIVLVHYDPDTHTLSYIDPADHNTEKHMDVSIFISKWGLGAVMVNVLVGEREQRRMPEYWPSERINDEAES